MPRSLDGRWTNVSRLPRLSFLFLATPWELSQSSAFEAWLGNVQRICLIILMTKTLHMFIFLDLLGTISQVSVFYMICVLCLVFPLSFSVFSHGIFLSNSKGMEPSTDERRSRRSLGKRLEPSPGWYWYIYLRIQQNIQKRSGRKHDSFVTGKWKM